MFFLINFSSKGTYTNINLHDLRNDKRNFPNDDKMKSKLSILFMNTVVKKTYHRSCFKQSKRGVSAVYSPFQNLKFYSGHSTRK